MSVRRATCPGCNANLNVPATMTLIKCSACGTVWDVNNPSAAKKPAGAKPRSQTADSQQSSSGASSGGAGSKKKKPKAAAKQKQQAAMFAVAGAMLALLAIAGIAITVFSGSGDDDAPAADSATAVAPDEVIEKPPAYYRIVKLPESTRKKIYHSFRMAASSSVEKKVMIPKNSIAAKTLKGTMTAMVDREVEMLALQHRIKPDDVLQIVAEGNDKGWPPLIKKKQTAK